MHTQHHQREQQNLREKQIGRRIDGRKMRCGNHDQPVGRESLKERATQSNERRVLTWMGCENRRDHLIDYTQTQQWRGDTINDRKDKSGQDTDRKNAPVQGINRASPPNFSSVELPVALTMEPVPRKIRPL
jgi:hypothetical protein